MATHRLLLESLPVSPSVSRLRADGTITADMTSVWIGFGAIELKREVRLEHRRFPNGGSWTFLSMPSMRRAGAPSQAQRRPANVFALLRQLPPHFIRLARPAFDAREQRIEKLRKLIDGGPARLNPRPGRVRTDACG